MKTSISAVISTYNRAHFLVGLFESIVKQSLNRSRFEIVIINNNSNDNTEEICSGFIKDNPDINISYFVEKKQGLSFGRNRGIQESSMDLVTFLDDDCTLKEDFLENNTTFFNNNPNVSAGGGKIYLNFLCDKPGWYNPFMARLLGYTYMGEKDKKLKNKYFSGSNMTFRRDIFLRYNGFDTSLGRKGKDLAGSEEVEFFFRLKDGGEEMWYISSAIVYHQIPEERTRLDFIKRQSIGTGKSQKQGALIKSSRTLFIARLKEIAKWFVTIILSFIYLLTLRLNIASTLIKFRYWVSQGIFSK